MYHCLIQIDLHGEFFFFPDHDTDENPDRSGNINKINPIENFCDVIHENPLDPATLAAQSKKTERLKKVQEHQQKSKEVRDPATKRSS